MVSPFHALLWGPYSGKPNASGFTQGIVSQQPFFERLNYWKTQS
jgi:hypothetical protein